MAASRGALGRLRRGDRFVSREWLYAASGTSGVTRRPGRPRRTRLVERTRLKLHGVVGEFRRHIPSQLAPGSCRTCGCRGLFVWPSVRSAPRALAPRRCDRHNVHWMLSQRRPWLSGRYVRSLFRCGSCGRFPVGECCKTLYTRLVDPTNLQAFTFFSRQTVHTWWQTLKFGRRGSTLNNLWSCNRRFLLVRPHVWF
jgi:hypothetical protein